MKRGTILFGVGVLVVVAAVVLSYLFVVAGRDYVPPPPPAPPPAARGEPSARLAVAEGDVQVRSGESDWLTVAQGATLDVGTRVRTGPDGRAVVAFGEDLKVRLASGSDVRVGEVRRDLARMVIGDGLVFADVRPGAGPRLEITNERGEAVATATDASLSVAGDPSGTLRAAVSRGSAQLTANGQTVTLGPGYSSIVRPGGRPSKPSSVPGSLLLKVRWPTETLTAARRQQVSGTASPGARVHVGPRPLWADANGRFETVVDLREGKNRIEVRAVDLGGHEARAESPTIELDTHAPKQVIETSPDMWKQP